jgi:hypothetical protein
MDDVAVDPTSTRIVKSRECRADWVGGQIAKSTDPGDKPLIDH